MGKTVTIEDVMEEEAGLMTEIEETEEKPSDLVPGTEEFEEEDDYVPRFEIRERTLGLADPKIIPATKENLARIMIGLLTLDEIKEIEKRKEESLKR